eukprot:Platyproteum_vivax@DN1046_c0_g1_i1.p1
MAAKVLIPNPRTFFDVSIAGRAVGKIKFELFMDELPITAENFRCLCTGETGLGYWFRPRWYKYSNFYRVIPGFMCQGGDYNFGNGKGGESIYGQRFRDEKFLYRHSQRGLLSMANTGQRHWNNSSFFITFAPLPHLDGKHVVFGQVEDGFNVLDEIEKAGTEIGYSRKTVSIFNSGEVHAEGILQKRRDVKLEAKIKRAEALEREGKVIVQKDQSKKDFPPAKNKPNRPTLYDEFDYPVDPHKIPPELFSHNKNWSLN